MKEYKPCPFCGKHPRVPSWDSEDVCCTNKDCPMEKFNGVMKIDQWNKRPYENELLARIDDITNLDPAVEIKDKLTLAYHEMCTLYAKIARLEQ